MAKPGPKKASARGARVIGATEFKRDCLRILDELTPDGVVVTKKGRPVARLLPVGASNADLIGSLKGKLTIKRDVFSTGLRWDSES